MYYTFSLGLKQYQFDLSSYILFEDGIPFDLNREYVNTRKRVYIKTNDVCNFSCPYCYQKNAFAYDNYQPIHLRDYSIVEKVMNDDDVDIYLYGGEPLLDQEYENISWLLNNNKRVIRIFTNGSFSEKLQDLLLRKKNSFEAIITVDGPKDIHNARRISVNGDSFNIIFDNLCYLVANQFQFTIQINIDSNNINQISQLFNYFEVHLGVKDLSISLNPILHTSDSLPTLELLKLYIRLCQEYSLNKTTVNSRTLLKTVRLLTGQGYDSRRCEIDRTLVLNIPDETVFCCPQSTRTIIGNLRKSSIEIIDNEKQKYININSKNEAPCSICVYRNFCGLMCAIDQTDFKECKAIVQNELLYIFQNAEFFLRPR